MICIIVHNGFNTRPCSSSSSFRWVDRQQHVHRSVSGSLSISSPSVCVEQCPAELVHPVQVGGGGSGGTEGLPWTTAEEDQLPGQRPSARWASHTHTVDSHVPVNIWNIPKLSTGNFLWEKIHLEEILVSKQLSEALTEGLTILTAQKEVWITWKYTKKINQFFKWAVHLLLSSLRPDPWSFLHHFWQDGVKGRTLKMEPQEQLISHCHCQPHGETNLICL